MEDCSVELSLRQSRGAIHRVILWLSEVKLTDLSFLRAPTTPAMLRVEYDSIGSTFVAKAQLMRLGVDRNG